MRDLRKYARQTNTRLIIGGILLLVFVGGGLIYLIYGGGAAITGLLCIFAGLVPILLIFLGPLIRGAVDVGGERILADVLNAEEAVFDAGTEVELRFSAEDMRVLFE